MQFLPPEVQFKILQNLNFDELILIKQTSHHFYDFISKHGDSLARKRFNNIILDVPTSIYYEHDVRKIDFSRSAGPFLDFPYNKELIKKWNLALDERIPVYLNSRVNTPPQQKLALFFYNDVDNNVIETNLYEYYFPSKCTFILTMPLYPKNFVEFKFVRYWLNQIFHCDFEYLNFSKFLFNPEMIELLFDSEEIKKLKINCQKSEFCFFTPKLDVWKFFFEHLVISELIWIRFESLNTSTDDDNILLHILLNEGIRIPEVVLFQPKRHITLIKLIIEHVEKTKDLSKLVTKITFDCIKLPISELIIKGKVEEEYNDNIKYYELANTNNTMKKFSIRWICSKKNNLINNLKIMRID